MSTLLSFTVRDFDGDRHTIQVFVDDGWTLAQYTSYAQELATRVDNVTSGVIEDIRLGVGIAKPGGIATNPIAGEENQRGALLNFATTGRYTHSVRVPAVPATMFVGKDFDVPAASPQESLIEMLGGAGFDPGTGSAEVAQNGHDEAYTSYVKGTKSHRK